MRHLLASDLSRHRAGRHNRIARARTPQADADAASPSPDAWSRLPDHKLLDVRLCDLDLRPRAVAGDAAHPAGSIASSSAGSCAFRPHFWLSDEWYSPDGVPGIAIPFYLAHPRLAELERSQMREVEGGTPEWCMRILRHEAGHAIENAYRLRRRRRRQQLFGKTSQPYPQHYAPEAVQQALRAPPGGVLRAEPPGRGLRRDVRRVADAQLALAAALHRLAGAAEARVRRRADARAGGRAGRAGAASRRVVDPLRTLAQDAARALPREALALRRRRACASTTPRCRARLLRPRRPTPTTPSAASFLRSARTAAPPQGGRADRRAPLHHRPGPGRHDRARGRAAAAPHALRPSRPCSTSGSC